MNDFLSSWRRRLALHAATVFLVFGLIVAVRFMLAQDTGALPAEIERWRQAHLEGLTRSLLLFGLAGSLHLFRLSRGLVAFSATTIIVATWAGGTSAVLTALWGVDGRGGWTPSTPLDPPDLLLHRIVMIVAAVASVGTVVAIGAIVLRAVWEALREGLFPRSWRNWARIVFIRPRSVEEPKSKKELEAIVKKALESRTPLRAFGSRATWNALATTHGVMIDMQHLKDIKPVQDGDTWVEVEAGVEIGVLSQYLFKQGYMLESTPVIPWVQIGGAIATCSHGTGTHHDQFTDLVREIEILHDDGTQPVWTTRTRIPGDDTWNALITNLGALGVVYKVKLDIIEHEYVHYRDIERDMRKTIDDDLLRLLREDLVTGHLEPRIYSEVLWFPYNEKCIVKQWHFTAPPSPGPVWPEVFIELQQFLQVKFLVPLLHHILSLFPYLTPPIMRLTHNLSVKENRVMPAHEGMQYIKHYARVVAMSYAIPFDPSKGNMGMANVRRAWYAVVERLESLEQEGVFPLNMVLHARFVKDGQALLNPAWDDPVAGTHYTCHIEVLTGVNTPRYEEFFRDLEQQWMRMGGRPHWGKLTFWPDRVRDTLHPGNLAKWSAVRDTLDPRALFMNDYLREILRLPE